MRIENLLLNSVNINNSDNVYKEGSILRGQIIEILEGVVLIDIKGQGVIKAISDSDIKALIGNEISFLVKSGEDGQMQLKPLINEGALSTDLIHRTDDSISKLLNRFNIKETKLSIDLVENLMKYNAPINEENIIDGIKSLEKLIRLITLNDNDKVILFENKDLGEKKITYKEELENEENLKSMKFGPEKTLVEDILKNDSSFPEKTNIKNLLIVDKNDYLEKEDISDLVKEFLGNEIKTGSEEFIKILSFFIKSGIEPSLNNIKNLKELLKDPIEFSKDFVKLNILLDKFKNKGNFNKLKDFAGNIQLNKEDIEESSQNIKQLQKIIGESEIKTSLGSNFKKEINDLENKIDFLKEMDQDLSFLVLPLNYGKEELDGVLTLLKENKSRKTMDDKINVFINLNTNNLGNIKISCQASLESLSIRMNVQKIDLKLFQSAEQGLIDRVSSMGYMIDRIDFIVGENINIMDTMVTNPNPTYFLDIRV